MVDDSLERDPRTALAAAGLDEAVANVAATRARYLPQISTVNTVGVGDGRLVDNQIDNRLGIQASQHLFSFGAAGLAMDERRLDRQAALFGTVAADQETALEAAVSVVNLWRVRQLIDISERRLEAYESDLEAVQALFASRMATSVLLTEVQANVALVQLTLARLTNEEIFAKARLARLAGTETVCASELWIRELLESLQDRPIDETISDAIALSPVVSRLDVQADAARTARKRIGRERYPELRVSAFTANEYSDFPNESDNVNRLGLNLRADFISGGRVRAERAAAAARVRAAEAQAGIVRTQLTEEITAAWTIVNSQRSILSTLDVAIDSLSEQRRLREDEFAFGAASQRDLLNATTALYDAEAQRIETLAEYFRNGMTLIYLADIEYER
ncbi:MAG: TolC family protein [Pseudomonadota bacterium]